MATQGNMVTDAHHAHREAMEQIHQLLTRLQMGVDAQLTPASEALHWGHAGDAQRVASSLRQLSDQVFREGEYA